MELPSDRTCPVCGRNRAEAAYVTPCRHQLCLGCALRWAKQHRTCAVCKENIEAVRYAVQSEEDFLACPIPQPAGRSEDEQEEEQGSAEPQLEAPEHGFPAETWADFFRGDPGDLEPLLRWIQQELERLTRAPWWDVLARRSTIMGYLCIHGLDEEVLFTVLQPLTENFTRAFTRELIDTVTALYGPELHRQQDNQAAHETGGQDGPTATPSPSTSLQEPPAPGPGRSASPPRVPTGTAGAAGAGGGSGPLRPGHGPPAWGAPTPPEEEGQQLPPRFVPIPQEAALGQHPLRC